MITMLGLPRELYLECCEYLKRHDLSKLSRVSRDHYLAVQEPLYGMPQNPELVEECANAFRPHHHHDIPSARGSCSRDRKTSCRLEY